MKRFLQTILCICGLMLLSACEKSFIHVSLLSKLALKEESVVKSVEVINLELIINSKVGNPLNRDITVTWEYTGEEVPSGFVIARTTGAVAAPVDCSTGSVVPKEDIVGTSHKLNDVDYGTEQHIRICPVDSKGEIREEGAYAIDVIPGNGLSVLSAAPLYNLANPCGCSAIGFGTLNAFMGDQNNDGREDFIYRNHTNDYQVISGIDNTSLFTIGIAASPTITKMKGIGDVNSDGRKDFVTHVSGTSFSVFSGATGALLRTISSPVGVSNFAKDVYSFGDTNGDNADDIWVTGTITATSVNEIYVYSGLNGALLSTYNSSTPNNHFKIESIGDYDGDGKEDYGIIDGKSLVLYKADHTVIRDFGEFFYSNNVYNRLFSLGDTDGDGKSEFAIRFIRDNGDRMFSVRNIVSTDPLYTFRAFYRSLISEENEFLIKLHDMNNDGVKDFAYYQTTGDLFLGFISGKDGKVMKYIHSQNALYLSPTSGDYNNDGKMDIITSGGSTVSVYSLASFIF